MIREKRVSVNGNIINNPSFRCAVAHDRIAVDGMTVKENEPMYFVLHKPVGVVTTRSDERGRSTVYDVLGDVGRWVFPVGRLDKDTSGLLLFTNDHRLGEQLTSPLSKVPKTYLVGLDKPLTDRDATMMRKGMLLDGERLLPANVIIRKGGTIEMTIVEGKNRQIRRMCESLGYMVMSLARIRIGACELGTLKQGEVRKLKQSELTAFLKK